MTRIILLLLACIMFSCKSNKQLTSSDNAFVGNVLAIDDKTCKEDTQSYATNAESTTGIILCDGYTLSYTQAKHSDRGPLTVKEEFRNSFNTIYHRKFFEEKMIDKKVYRIFLDSVDVLDVRPKTDGEEPMYECTQCNAIAELKFLGDTHLFPIQIAQNSFTKKETSFVEWQKDNYVYKHYKTKENIEGLYIDHYKNTYRNKKTISIDIQNKSLESADLFQKLRTIEVLKTD